MGELNDPTLKQVEFDLFRNEAGANYFTISLQKWIEGTKITRQSPSRKRWPGHP
jgi:hypothetical protein